MNKRKKKKSKTKSFDSSFESGSMDMVFENNFSGTVKHFSEGVSALDENMEPNVQNLSPQDDQNLGIASLASLTDLSPYDFDPSKADMTDNSDMFCDGPGARTRSKMGQDNDTNSNDLATTDAKQHIPSPSFLVQIPFYAYKKEKNRKCSVCGKHGRTPSDLLRHMRVHTGERPFPCVGCDKRFKCKRSQLTHQYLTHGIKEGLSDHRLQVLESKKMRHRTKKAFLDYEIPPPLLENQVQILPEQEPPIRPVSVDQDEDTEIMAEDEQQTTSTNGDIKTSFEGLFSPLSEDQCPLLSEQSGIMNQTQVMNDCSNLHYSAGDTSRIGEGEEECVISENREEMKKESPIFNTNDVGRIGPAQSAQPGSPKVPILRIKTHKCTYCKRQFRSIYTLRYHLRSMHDEKVYLSPALESRLKKRRWLPPHVRLQKSKLLALSSLLKSKALAKEKKISSNASTSKIQEKIQVEEQNIPIQGETFLPPEKEPDTEKVPVPPEQKQLEVPELCEIKKDSIMEASKMFLPNIKTEKQDPMIEELNLTRDLLNDVNNNSSTLRSILTSKESIFNPISHYSSTLPNQIPLFSNSNYGMNGNATTNSKSGTNPYVVPPHIFLPSNPQLEEGLQNNQPISWESLHVTSENVLVTKMEAVHPTTHQKYVLYKCSHCGKAYSGLRAIGMHLASHSDIAGKDCEKCGASFKWRNELDSHLECHRADRKFIPSSPFLPSYYVNPFPIPVLPTNEQTVMSTPGLLSYPFFPMPQQIPPLVQPGFFPFFAAALQPPSQMQPNDVASVTSVNNTTHSVSEELKNNLDEKNVDQNCTFQCKLCPKTFDRIFSLQRHERIHSGVKACFCKTCGRGFSELRNLRHHIVRFHAEAAKMEPLPYRRQPTRMRNSSQRLVSFLKKTAVRILNSMGQNKLDGSASSVKIQTDEYSMSKNNHVEETAQNLSTKDNRHPSPENKTTDPGSNISLNREGDHLQEVSPPTSLANKQNYLQVPELDDLPTLSTRASVIQEAAKNSSQSKSGSNGGRQLEVLQDPKRSLLGNRRKGRPFKLTTNTCNFLNPLSDENLYAITQNILNGMPKLSLEQPGAFLQATQAAVSSIPSEVNMPQLSFFNSEPPAIEPIDMRNVKDVKPREEIKPEPVVNTEPVKVDNTISTTNFPTFGLDAVSALNVNASVLSGSDGKPTMFPCNYCNRSFSSLSDLNRHMSFHADIRPFKCPYCSYCSRTNSQLKVHMMRHEGIKHYMCQICNYNGVTQSDLNRHLKTRTHLLRSRNVCACCGTGFHTRSLSEEHYKSCRLLANSGNKDQNKAPQEPQGRLTLENRHRGNRLKHVQKPKEDRPKTDFFQKLCDLRKMGIPFGDFLPPNSSANAVK